MLDALFLIEGSLTSIGADSLGTVSPSEESHAVAVGGAVEIRDEHAVVAAFAWLGWCRSTRWCHSRLGIHWKMRMIFLHNSKDTILKSSIDGFGEVLRAMLT